MQEKELTYMDIIQYLPDVNNLNSFMSILLEDAKRLHDETNRIHTNISLIPMEIADRIDSLHRSMRKKQSHGLGVAKHLLAKDPSSQIDLELGKNLTDSYSTLLDGLSYMEAKMEDQVDSIVSMFRPAYAVINFYDDYFKLQKSYAIQEFSKSLLGLIPVDFSIVFNFETIVKKFMGLKRLSFEDSFRVVNAVLSLRAFIDFMFCEGLPKYEQILEKWEKDLIKLRSLLDIYEATFSKSL